MTHSSTLCFNNGQSTTVDTLEAADAYPAPSAQLEKDSLSEQDRKRLRFHGWRIGEQSPAWSYIPTVNHVGLAVVRPGRGFVHWRILDDWANDLAIKKGDAWHHCRLVLRLYNVTCVEFDGFNAHRLQDYDLPALTGHYFFSLPDAHSVQLGEVGFLLRNGEFIAAARSQPVTFPPAHGSSWKEHHALRVDEDFTISEVPNVWTQEVITPEPAQPKLKQPLRLGMFAMESLPSGQTSALATFVTELARGLAQQQHEVVVFLPHSPQLSEPCQLDGVHYEPVAVDTSEGPLEVSERFARATEHRVAQLSAFDLLHVHEWIAGRGQWFGKVPTFLSLNSLESTRRNGSVTESSKQIETIEENLVREARCVLCANWVVEELLAKYAVDADRVCGFAMEGRLPNEWEAPLDLGMVKREIHVGPVDRLLLFVGPLEHEAGPDLLLDAMPIALGREPQCRLAFVGEGMMRGHLEHLAHQRGVHHAVRFLGHVEGPHFTRLLRAAEALVLPSRWRVPMDDAVVDLARKASRPVITTHSGPAHLVRHEETGLVTYDNPGSMVWAIDRILSDPSHAQAMGRNGSYSDGLLLDWNKVAAHYLELCAQHTPELLMKM